jgi:hypothetical protein
LFALAPKKALLISINALNNKGRKKAVNNLLLKKQAVSNASIH